jgi:hypothetical protein
MAAALAALNAAPADAAKRADVLKLAAEAWSLLSSGSQSNPDYATARQNAKQAMGGLFGVGAEDAAIDFAKGTGDTDLETYALNQIRNRYKGVAGQQHVITKAGRLAGITIPAAAAGQKSTDWLEKNTELAGRAFKKLQDMGLSGLKGGDVSLELARELLEQYLTDAGVDVKPDPLGHVGGQKADPASGQILADCDVWATYGARLLRAMGWDTVGYLAIVPEDPDRSGHAVALVKKANAAASGGFDWAGISDFYIEKLTATSEQTARDPLFDLAWQIYASPKPAKWKAYYLSAGPGGAYDVKILDPAANNLTPFKTSP